LRELLQVATTKQGDGRKLNDEEAKRMLKAVDKKNNGKVTAE
jgi:Ca2+-binding EF-hand superfamily protein